MTPTLPPGGILGHTAPTGSCTRHSEATVSSASMTLPRLRPDAPGGWLLPCHFLGVASHTSQALSEAASRLASGLGGIPLPECRSGWVLTAGVAKL